VAFLCEGAKGIPRRWGASGDQSGKEVSGFGLGRAGASGTGTRCGCSFCSRDDRAFLRLRPDGRGRSGHNVARVCGSTCALDHEAAQGLGGCALAQRFRRVNGDTEPACLRRDLGDLCRGFTKLR